MITGIVRNFRGFSYRDDWSDVDAFWKAMIRQRDTENDEVNWAKCFDEHGTEVAEYRRGHDIEQFEIKD